MKIITCSNMKIIVITSDNDESEMFNFVDLTYLTNQLSEVIKFDHGF